MPTAASERLEERVRELEAQLVQTQTALTTLFQRFEAHLDYEYQMAEDQSSLAHQIQEREAERLRSAQAESDRKLRQMENDLYEMERKQKEAAKRAERGW